MEAGSKEVYNQSLSRQKIVREEGVRKKRVIIKRWDFLKGHYDWLGPHRCLSWEDHVSDADSDVVLSAPLPVERTRQQDVPVLRIDAECVVFIAIWGETNEACLNKDGKMGVLNASIKRILDWIGLIATSILGGLEAIWVPTKNVNKEAHKAGAANLTSYKNPIYHSWCQRVNYMKQRRALQKNYDSRSHFTPHWHPIT